MPIRRYSNFQRRTRLVALRLQRRTGLQTAQQITVFAQLVIGLISYLFLTDWQPGQRLHSPPWMPLILVSNLLPAILLIVFYGRWIALKRAKRSTIGGNGRLHVRLVGIFSTVAAVPMLLMVIFASFLFQFGVDFWFSERARAVLENASRLAEGYYHERSRDVANETMTMAGDLRHDLTLTTMRDPAFAQAYGQQVYLRKLSESAIIEIDGHGVAKTLAAVNPDARAVEKRMTLGIAAQLQHGAPYVSLLSPDRIESVTRLFPNSNSYLYASRIADSEMLAQTKRAKSVLADYDLLLERSQRLQLYFNGSLLIFSLLIVVIAVNIALRVADRLVRPISHMVDAARKFAGGDLAARVPNPLARDEIGGLGRAFNTMAQRLSVQTAALLDANQLLDRRRALTEAVLSSVSAGVLAVDRDHNIRIINASACNMLSADMHSNLGTSLAQLAPELDMMLREQEFIAIKQLLIKGVERTLAVKIVRDEIGHVLTFDDITTQINDQRRAAWADIARRIAHEIKNPLTPIQLAAERLQRRYGNEITSDPATFVRLTETIVRQVGDLRRMVDEFSSFASIPKPEFQNEDLVEIAQQAVFLHEVAHPNICFSIESAGHHDFVCDRRQISQALINLLKNAIEAIEEKALNNGSESITLAITTTSQDQIVITLTDTGRGLPTNRERLAEPYMTTRARGTGLGLAIVHKIVEDHNGTIELSDNPLGGSIVTVTFNPVSSVQPGSTHAQTGITSWR